MSFAELRLAYRVGAYKAMRRPERMLAFSFMVVGVVGFVQGIRHHNVFDAIFAALLWMVAAPLLLLRKQSDDPVGLCLTCRHMQLITSDRGSRFYRCGKSDVDPNFAKYPRLPVLRCSGYEQADRSDVKPISDPD